MTLNCNGIAIRNVSKSVMGCTKNNPFKSNKGGNIYTSGMNIIPWRAMDRKEAENTFPRFCCIILQIVIQAFKEKLCIGGEALLFHRLLPLGRFL